MDASAGATVEAVQDLLPDGADYAFDAIGGRMLTEQCIAMLGMGGTAVVVGIPPAGVRAGFDPGTLVAVEQRILGSTYGGIDPARDIPRLVEQYLAGDLLLDEQVSRRRPHEDATASLDDLASGTTLRELLILSAARPTINSGKAPEVVRPSRGQDSNARNALGR